MYSKQKSKNKSLGERSKVGMIVGKQNEIMGYRVYTPMHKIVFVKKFIKKLETLKEEQTAQLRRVHSPQSVESSGVAVTAPVKDSENNQ